MGIPSHSQWWIWVFISIFTPYSYNYGSLPNHSKCRTNSLINLIYLLHFNHHPKASYIKSRDFFVFHTCSSSNSLIVLSHFHFLLWYFICTFLCVWLLFPSIPLLLLFSSSSSSAVAKDSSWLLSLALQMIFHRW